jgi:maltokinase
MAVEDGFRVTMHAWVAPDDESERAMGVDQLNESWVVGGRLVVKWVTDDLDGPHPAADRLRRLADAAFEQAPTLVGLLEWQQADGDWAPVAFAQEYLAGAEDGWTWVMAEARRELGLEDGEQTPFADALGGLTAHMHLALAADPAEQLSPELAAAQAEDARSALDEAVRLTSASDPESHRLLVAARGRIESDLAGLDRLGGSPGVAVHGDYHVGQVLRTPGGALYVVDFDGNPTRPAELRAAPSAAARDVAGMVMALENVGHLVSHRAPEVDPSAVDGWVREVQEQFLAAYVEGLGERRDLFDEALLPAFEWEQLCRELVYTARHLPTWSAPRLALARRTVG